MDSSKAYLEGLGPFLIYATLVIAVVGIMLALSFFLGQRINRQYKETPFESGIISVGSSQFRISVHFYLTAILFIIFDLEIAFLFPWAISLGNLGPLGFWSMMIFLLILTIGFIYEWKKGALDWD